MRLRGVSGMCPCSRSPARVRCSTARIAADTAATKTKTQAPVMPHGGLSYDTNQVGKKWEAKGEIALRSGRSIVFPGAILAITAIVCSLQSESRRSSSGIPQYDRAPDIAGLHQ